MSNTHILTSSTYSWTLATKEIIPVEPQRFKDREPDWPHLRKLHPARPGDVSPGTAGSECAPSPLPFPLLLPFRAVSVTWWFWVDVPNGLILRDKAPSFPQGVRISAHYSKTKIFWQENWAQIQLVWKLLEQKNASFFQGKHCQSLAMAGNNRPCWSSTNRRGETKQF